MQRVVLMSMLRRSLLTSHTIGFSHRQVHCSSWNWANNSPRQTKATSHQESYHEIPLTRGNIQDTNSVSGSSYPLNRDTKHESQKLTGGVQISSTSNVTTGQSLSHGQREVDTKLDVHGHPVIDLAFYNAMEAYKSKTTSELFRALLVFNLCSVKILVKNNQKLLKLIRQILGRNLFHRLMKMTFYGHFVAGENQQSIRPVIVRNRTFGVKSILDYSAEEDLSSEQAKDAEKKAFQYDDKPSDDPVHRQFSPHEEDRRERVVSARTYFYEGEAQCDHNMNIFIDCIDAVSDATDGSGFAAIKLTALGRPQLLLQLSEVLVQMRTFFEKFGGKQGNAFIEHVKKADIDGAMEILGIPASRDESHKWFTVLDVSKARKEKDTEKSLNYAREIDLLDWDNLIEVNTSLSKLFVVPNMQSGKWEPLMKTLTENEEGQMKNMLRRINKIVQYAVESNVRVMVDAEQTYLQPAISRLTIEMMRKFNTNRTVIFNTYQSYLKQAYNNIIVDMDLARKEGFYFGAKVVRGAYMEQERLRAQQYNYEDPINDDYDATTVMYHSIMEEVMRQIRESEPHHIAVMVASHNEDTVRFTVQMMKDYGIKPTDKVICFGQLLGMCDQVSFPLGQAGYSVYKYVPYGPIDEVLPYLSRRAMENKGILKKVKKEKSLLRKELFRRVLRGQWRHDPEMNAPFKI